MFVVKVYKEVAPTEENGEEGDSNDDEPPAKKKKVSLPNGSKERPPTLALFFVVTRARRLLENPPAFWRTKPSTTKLKMKSSPAMPHTNSTSNSPRATRNPSPMPNTPSPTWVSLHQENSCLFTTQNSKNSSTKSIKLALTSLPCHNLSLSLSLGFLVSSGCSCSFMCIVSFFSYLLDCL